MKHEIDPSRPCFNCPLSDQVKVGYEGKIGRKVMLVAERPGYVEIREGRPLVGKSGQLLERVLNSVGLYRSDVVLANARKCFKEDETPEEKSLSLKHCRHYLVKAIEQVKPTLIVPLGNDALKMLTGRSGIMDKMGKLMPSEEFGCQVLPNCHPAAVLRDPAKYSEFAKVFVKVRDFHEGRTTVQTGHYYRATH